jgi:hypothetical protein
VVLWKPFPAPDAKLRKANEEPRSVKSSAESCKTKALAGLCFMTLSDLLIRVKQRTARPSSIPFCGVPSRFKPKSPKESSNLEKR